MPGGIVRIVRQLFVTAYITVGASTLSALAQPPQVGRIHGRVVDQAGLPIPNALVTIAGTGLRTLTAVSGRYAFDSVPVGTVGVRAQFVGYKTAEVQGVRVRTGRTATRNLVLELLFDLEL